LDASDAIQEVRQKHNIGIDVTEQIVTSAPRDVIKRRPQDRCSEFISVDVTDETRTGIARYLLSTWVIAANENLDLRPKGQPILDRVSLDDTGVTAESFGNAE